jgi:hypothetical protein
MRCPVALGDPSQPCRPAAVHPGVCGGRRGAARSTPPRRAALALDRRRDGTLVGVGAGDRADALIGVIETGSGSGSGATLPQPWNSAVERSQRCQPPSTSEQGAVHAQPRSLSQATCTRARCCRRQPGPPRFTYEVQLLGGEAGRLLAQQQAEAMAAVLAWLAGHPPTPTAAAGSAAATPDGRPVGQSTAMPAGTRPAPPSPAGPADGGTQPRTGGGVGRYLSILPALDRSEGSVMLRTS